MEDAILKEGESELKTALKVRVLFCPQIKKQKIMNQIKKLDKYCEDMLLQYEIKGGLLLVDSKKYSIIDDDLSILFDENFDFIPTDISLDESVNGFVYEFGGRWYTQDLGHDVSLTELKYIGKPNRKIETKSFLGMRSGYELFNGIGLYKDWVRKSKFLGVEALGVCEKHNLSGALEFQKECLKEGIKPIFGMTVEILDSEPFDLKVYAKNFQGWLQLLEINTQINVKGNKGIDLDFLLDNSSDLFVILDPKYISVKSANKRLLQRADFYQLETVNFLNHEKDDEFLSNLEGFMKSDIPPISITDAFYLEKDEFITREALWSINKSFDDKTDNQYFKSKDQYAKELISMFDSNCKTWFEIFKAALKNESELVESCNFIYDTDTRHLPKYQMTKEEAEQFSSSEELFMHLIKEGFKKRKFSDPKKYLDRLKKEISVLKMGDVIDYFLDLYNIIKFAKSKGYLVGIGRGSAGGSLVAYLLDIIQLDPLEFDLLFERFLNSGRMGVFEDRPAYILHLEDGTELKLVEGSLVKVNRSGVEKVIFINEVEEGDEILKY